VAGGAGTARLQRKSACFWLSRQAAVHLEGQSRRNFVARFRVHGKSAHVGLQHLGEETRFERMHRVVEQLQELKREVEQRVTNFNVGAETSAQLDSDAGGDRAGGRPKLQRGAGRVPGSRSTGESIRRKTLGRKGRS